MRSSNAATIQGPGPNPGDGYPVDVNVLGGGGPIVVTNDGIVVALGDGASNSQSLTVDEGGNPIGYRVFPYSYNEATWDRQRGNVEATLLASAARTASTNSGTQVNFNHRGATFFLNVTASPGGAETLSVRVQYRDPASSVFADAFVSTAITGTGLKIFQVYPGASGANGSAAIALPRRYVVRVQHSSSGPSWTYSLGSSSGV